ncbi:NAD-binding protein [Schizopora paradoxa]|uniref:NAD-binding protein n=1 Tax=Schizopora paradoxa TaxID=27342 RepID=A0A0H2R8S1_9AGAM|nr:NAD-binding protein [Schizopora paradoxa]
MANSLAGKKIVIVGGTSGMGFAVAKFSLLDHAGEVVVASSKKDNVDGAVARLNAIIAEHKLSGKVEGAVVDAGDAESIKALMTKVGELDHLVWTAMGDISKGFPGNNPDEQRGIFDIKFWGAATAVQVAKFRPGGSLTQTSGTVLLRPQAKQSLLCGAAGALDGLTRGLAVDLAPVRVNVVAPGLVQTEFWDKMPMPQAQKDMLYEQYKNKLLLKHIANADEVADAFLFCMKCRYLTGQRIVVDGGLVLI